MNFTKNILHCILTLLFVGCSTMHAMIKEKKADISKKEMVELVIFPQTRLPLYKNESLCSFSIHTNLKGKLFSEQKVDLLDDDDDNQSSKNCYSYNSGDKEVYTLKTISDALKCKKTQEIPLRWLKKINCTVALSIVIYNKNTNKYKPVALPEKVLGRISKYLSYDITNENRDCQDFFHNVFGTEMDQMAKRADMNVMKKGFEKLKPGDGIVLFDHKPFMNNIAYKHAAIFLGTTGPNGDGIYLSKGGKGGPLIVMTLEAMMIAWQCNSVYRVPYIVAFAKEKEWVMENTQEGKE